MLLHAFTCMYMYMICICKFIRMQILFATGPPCSQHKVLQRSALHTKAMCPSRCALAVLSRQSCAPAFGRETARGLSAVISSQCLRVAAVLDIFLYFLSGIAAKWLLAAEWQVTYVRYSLLRCSRLVRQGLIAAVEAWNPFPSPWTNHNVSHTFHYGIL
jgi:hypothetical protein